MHASTPRLDFTLGEPESSIRSLGCPLGQQQSESRCDPNVTHRHNIGDLQNPPFLRAALPQPPAPDRPRNQTEVNATPSPCSSSTAMSQWWR
jgi:hypothetical protein